MMTSQHPVAQNDAWNLIHNSCPFRIWNKKWGSTDILKSYGEFKNRHFLTIFSIFGIFARARILRFSARVLRYYRSRRTGNQLELFRIVLEIQNMWKNGVSTFRTCNARKNARADAHARNFSKCSKWPETYTKLEMKWFGAFYNFDARVRVRHGARAHAHKLKCWPMTWS